MNAYIYQAALLCERCAGQVKLAHLLAGTAPAYPADETSYDSDDYPKGPYSDGGGASDSPQHCDHCSAFLENPLTSDGWDAVQSACIDDMRAGRLPSVALTEWAAFYGIKVQS
jgi:hypothetical protein